VKKLSDHSIFDNELYKLDSDIIWKKANSIELKKKLMADMNKKSQRGKVNMFIGHFVRVGAVAAIVFIGFIFLNQNIKDAPFMNGSNIEEINQLELPIKSGDQTVAITAKEQNLIENYTVTKTLTLTEEATFPMYISDAFSPYMEKPEVIARKEKDHVLVNLIYPDDTISIESTINEQGSDSLEYNSLRQKYPNSLSVKSISKSALLIEPDNKKPHLLIVTDKFIYKISGSKSNEDLIKTAELIQFKN
jgi:hypothetical protein